MTPEELFLANQATIDRIVAFVCRRHHASIAEAQDFASRTYEKLIEDDYAVLRKFEGRCKLATFLAVTIEHLFLDYRNAEWGKWRPSAVARRLGETAMLLERLMTRDGYTFEEAVEFIGTIPTVTATRAELDAIAARLPDRAPRRYEDERALVNLPAKEMSDDALERSERRALATRIAAVLQQEKARLPPQDQLILAQRFEDGVTVAHIATVLGVDQKGLYRRIEQLLKKLRAALEAEGLGPAELAYLFEKPPEEVDHGGE